VTEHPQMHALRAVSPAHHLAACMVMYPRAL
jgi:hypothetical protein